MASSTLVETGEPTREVRWIRLAADIILAGLCGLPSLIMLLFVRPHQRGYFCNDATLSYPYVDGSIPTQMMAIIGFAIAIAVITYCEIMRVVFWESPNRPAPLPYRKVTYHIGQRNIHRVFIRLYKFIGYFTLGAAFSMMFVDVTKYTAGRLRPHFYAVCQPVPVGAPNCSLTDGERYIRDYVCTGSHTYSAHRLKEVHLSFYSGHSSFAFYTAMYVMLYLQARVRSVAIFLSPVLVPIVQLFVFVLAMFSAILNEIEHHHHWSDVLLGVIMGSLIALIVACFIAKMFHQEKTETVVRRVSVHRQEVGSLIDKV
uniref:Phosphatidic acid phosphatase type 2/haloperoxidase domain-containing protein n=1 Tax=Plectus sambesii TaxID=2011161 RepID=A0A914VWH1_9BILA